jgi:very-short-patch-repair endonuclease
MSYYAFYYYHSKLIPYAQINRLKEVMTKPEALVRHCILKGKKLKYKFRRQKPIENFILDFYCPELKLWIEVDGGYHKEEAQAEYDEMRTKSLNTFGVKIIRVSNEEVLGNLDWVGYYLETQIQERAKEIAKKV